MVSDGVLRKSSNARYTSCLLSIAFLSRFLQVLTVFSTFPFACGYLGDVVVHVLEMPVSRESAEFSAAELGPVVCYNHVRNTVLRKVSFGLVDDCCRCGVTELVDFKKAGIVVN